MEDLRMKRSIDQVLTDDELMALAFTESVPWTRPLATVAVHDERERTMAVGRGLRSLAIRGLLDEGGLPIEPLREVGRASGAPSRAVAAWIDSDYRVRQDMERFEVLRVDDDSWLALTVAPGGTHRFVSAELKTICAFFAALLDSWRESPALLVLGRKDHRVVAALRADGVGIARLPLGFDGEPDVDALGPILEGQSAESLMGEMIPELRQR